MRNIKADRRSTRSRRLLSEALMTLMMEKAYNSITVQDIIDRADVGRSTFYAHYLDKDDVLSSAFGRLVEELSLELGHAHEENNLILPSLGLFRHVQQHYQLYKALAAWGQGLDFVTKTIQSLLIKRIEDQLNTLLPEQHRSSKLLPLISTYVAGAFSTVIQWWLDNQMIYSPEQMDEFFQQLVMPGIHNLLDIKP